MTFKFILVVLPVLALATIKVEITDRGVDYYGKDIQFISDAERTTFNVTKENLKNAVRAHLGKRPDDVFLRGPTGIEWQFQGNLYKHSEWKPVSRTLEAIHFKYRSRHGRTVFVDQIFENNSTKPVTFKVGFSQSVAHTASSSWSTPGEISNAKIHYSIYMHSANPALSLKYTSFFGQNTKQSHNVKIGGYSNKDITLQPGEAVVAQLEAIKQVYRIELEYRASLSGQVVVNYATKYDGHHFWAPYIGECLNSIGISNTKHAHEVIKLEYFTDFKIVVGDIRRGKLLMIESF